MVLGVVQGHWSPLDHRLYFLSWLLVVFHQVIPYFAGLT
jgi:hypothetical protein